MPDLSAALPDRPISVRPPATVGPASTFGLLVLLFGLLAGALWWLGPDLLQDWRTGRDTVEVRDARIVEASCRSRVLVFTVCDIAFAEAGVGAPARTAWYFFIGAASREPIVLLRPQPAPAFDPAAITTNLGQEKLYHRLIALILIVALLAFCIGVSIEVYRKCVVARRGFSALSGQRLSLMVVTIENALPVASKRRRWTYLYDDGERQERALVEFSSAMKPLFTTPDGKRALAVSGPGGGTPLLLDMPLSALDLTEAEKATFFESCRAAFEKETSS
jgi:hypothetical protein